MFKVQSNWVGQQHYAHSVTHRWIKTKHRLSNTVVIARLSTQWPSPERLTGSAGERTGTVSWRGRISTRSQHLGAWHILLSVPSFLWDFLSQEGFYHYAPWSSAWVGTANGETRGSEAQSMSWFSTSRSPWIGCFLTEGQFFPASCSPQIWF